jgi:TPR repeat protein
LAEQGDANSQSSIAYLFHEGKGVRQDSRIAAKWYYLAANQGEPTAQSFLCEMHLRGDGVARDLSLSLMWCELSIEGGEKRGIATRERVLSQMTEAQRDMGWKLVVRWREARAAAEASTPPINSISPFTYVDRQ